jgi:hypothetical protein
VGYAVSIGVCPTSRVLAPSGFARMLSVSPPPSATRIGTASSGTMSPGCVCRGNGRASNRWRPGSIRATCAPATSRCITSSRTPPGTTPPCCAWPAGRCWRRWTDTGRWRRGSSTIPGFPRRDVTPSAPRDRRLLRVLELRRRLHRFLRRSRQDDLALLLLEPAHRHRDLMLSDAEESADSDDRV